MADKNPALATLASNIKQGIESRLKELHTSMPGIVESFDAENQLATIQPAIRRIFVTRDGDKEILVPSDLPILINVPVIFPRGGGFSLTFPVSKGDECLLVFCERSIDNWHETGKVKSPGAKRFHSLSDATAFVGISSIPNKVPNYDDTNVQLKKDDGTVYITVKEDSSLDIHADSNINVSTDADIIATCENANITANTKIDLTAPTINLNGNTTIDGTLDVTGATNIDNTLTTTGTTTAPTVAANSSLTVAGKEMSNHKHAGSPTAPDGPVSDTGVPV